MQAKLTTSKHDQMLGRRENRETKNDRREAEWKKYEENIDPNFSTFTFLV